MSDEIDSTLRELRVAQAAIEGFTRFLAHEEQDAARAHCLAAILHASEGQRAALGRLTAELGRLCR